MFLAKCYLNYTLTAIVVITFSFALMATSHAAFDEGDIAGMWTFEEGKGKVVKDLSGNGTDGEFVGDLKWAKGKFGGGLEFNGADTWVKLGTKGEDKTLAALDFKDSKDSQSILGSMQQRIRPANVWYGKGLDARLGRSFCLERVHTRTAKIARKQRSTSALPMVARNLKSSVMNFRLKSGFTSLVHGMDLNSMSMLTANCKTPRMQKDRRGHLPKRSISVLTQAVANAVSGTVSLMKSLSLTQYSLMMT